MIITFYDKDFNALANNSSLVVENFKLTRRAYDLNEFSCVCEPISLDIDPLFAVLKKNDGTQYYDMLSPIITKGKNGKSQVVARDLLGLFNTDCLIDMSQFIGTTVREFLEFIYAAWRDWDDSGFANVTFIIDGDVTGLLAIDSDGNPIVPIEKKVYNAKDLFSKTLAYYGLFIESEIDRRNKLLKFRVRKNSVDILNIRLEDFGIEDFAKYEPSVNTAVVFGQRAGNIPVRHDWYLLKSGEITTNKSLRNVFPTAGKVFYVDGEQIDGGSASNEEKDAEFASAINAADFEAVCELAENRYQETIEINIVKDYERLQNVYFDTSFNVYYNGRFYKRLPLGEIVEDGTRNKILKIGFKPVEFIQVV